MAASTKPQVFTTTVSASSGSSTSRKPSASSRPASSSESTSLRAQPRVTRATDTSRCRGCHQGRVCRPVATGPASAAGWATSPAYDVGLRWPVDPLAPCARGPARPPSPRTDPSVDWIRTGGDACSGVLLPVGAGRRRRPACPVPSRTTTRAPRAGRGQRSPGPDRPTADRGRWLGPPDPLSTAWSGVWSGPPVTSRATDQHRISAITAATSTDQFGPPRVRADRAGAGQLGLEDPARVDRGVGVALVVRREQRRRVDAEHPGQGAQVAAGVEVATAGAEVVDLDRLDHVRADPGAVGELVDGQPEPRRGRPRTADRSPGRAAGCAA